MIKYYLKTYRFIFAAVMGITVMINFLPLFAKAADDLQLQNANVEASSNGILKLAPEDFLPIAVKLLNFGSQEEVDVLITYSILDNKKKVITSTTETVAVATTASFIKNLQLPSDIPSGHYIAHASIIYQDQVVPATTEFAFEVESKFLGLFQKEIMLYGSITVLVGIFTGMLGHLLVKQHRKTRLKPLEYSKIPREKRVFYELISDTILSMQGKVGDVAIDIAGDIDGLVIDKKTGRVLKISKSPSKIIALLVSEYEEILNQKVSFSFRKHKSTKRN